MTKRILLAGILGGVALFIWGGLSHMALGLGEVGVQVLPHEQPALDAMKASIPNAGLYYFPQGDASMKLTPAEENGPWGILIYHPTGATFAMSRPLLNECILNIVQALIAAFLLSLAAGLGGYPSRVGFVAALGLLATIGVNVEYWNWYGFPVSYTFFYALTEVIGFVCIGLVAAAVIKHAEPAHLSARAVA